jgi:hypothetical protein
MKKIFIIVVNITLLFFQIHAQILPGLTPDSVSISNSVHFDFTKIEVPPLCKLGLNEYQQDQTIPIAVNNCYNVYYPWPFHQTGLECGQSTSISQIFNYEICYKRGWEDINYNLDHKFPGHFVWNFCNDGIDQGVLFLESWKVVDCSGTTNYTDWGGYPQSGQHKKWINGYDKYYRAMQNRISEICAIPTDREEGILTLKHWLYNHIEGEAIGGLANFNATFKYPDSVIPVGFPGAGKYIITEFTNQPNHAYIILGYNDTIGWDYNNDHQLTNHIDLNNDGVINLLDWEKGCFIISHTSGSSWGDYGQCYLPYRLMATNYHDGGIWGTSAYVTKVKDQVLPRYTVKASVTYNKRGRIKIYYGISEDSTATKPSKIYEPYVFNYQGGDFYMTGGDSDSDKTLEFGIDLSPLLNNIASDQNVKFFLMIDENDPDNSGNGTLNRFSLMDYIDNEPIETSCSKTNIGITNNGTTIASIVYHFQVQKPNITDTIIQCTEGVPFSQTLHADGGIPDYIWEISKEYDVSRGSSEFPSGGKGLHFTDIDTGYATIDLPFSFPFYQQEFYKIYLFADGYLNFAVQDFYPFVYSNQIKLETTNMIAPFLSDLIIINAKLRYENNKIIVSCKAKIKDQSSSFITYAVILSDDGTIEFNYGSITYSGTPFISGISSGNIGDIVYSPLSAVKASILSKQAVVFKSKKEPDHIYVTNSGLIYGVVHSLSPDSILIKCKDNNGFSTQKWIQIKVAPFEGIQAKHFRINENVCNVAQKGFVQTLNFDLINSKDSVFSNISLHYQFESPYIKTAYVPIHLDSINSMQTISVENQIFFEPDTITPDHQAINFKWVLLSNSDSISKGLFPFIVETPMLEIQEYHFLNNNNNNSGNEYTLNIIIKNSNACSISNIDCQLSLLDQTYSIIPLQDGQIALDGFQTTTLSYIIKDPDYSFFSKEQILKLDIFNENQLIKSEKLNIYYDLIYFANPNPTLDFVEISSSDPLNRILQYEIFNGNGQLLGWEELNSNQIFLDCRNWTQGLYFIKITNKDNKIKTIKILKI